MPHIVICRDKPGALDLRLATREAHLAYIAETGAAAFGGPMLGDDGKPCGSILMLRTDDRAEAEAWAAADPYAQAGLFESVEIKGFVHVVGA
ncbi:YciI family protein [uncultured Albimonas sp.]|uniref:YciI family protein n=1 Tax=uncultured Albimonas sp. TaxID=1331701 RepID=UPI0030EEA8F7